MPSREIVLAALDKNEWNIKRMAQMLDRVTAFHGIDPRDGDED